MVPSRAHDPNGFRSVPPPIPSTTEHPVIVSQPTTFNTSIPGLATAVYGYGTYRAATLMDSELLERLHMPPGVGIPGWNASKLCLPPIRTAWDVNPMHNQPAPTPDPAPPLSPTQPIRAPHLSATLTSFRTLLPSSAGRNTSGGTSGNITPTTLGVSGGTRLSRHGLWSFCVRTCGATNQSRRCFSTLASTTVSYALKRKERCLLG
ncbi:hypothetical protein VFPPC_12047 [Pochonia chlamydosporia 170]|uniref:Uncharacterized protein n=1 Tax=Pochonia chlamydosporia 170 TaxID=1380566 RepID=A0A179F2S8_METCM|nr:hypothetical protein VFPPC_12047 [Pochonia chlamydosporia 170]OAQ59742.1 hypothetical protein VFPPC_12047 [Pochonia chlamydosporia 170]